MKAIVLVLMLADVTVPEYKQQLGQQVYFDDLYKGAQADPTSSPYCIEAAYARLATHVAYEALVLHEYQLCMMERNN